MIKSAYIFGRSPSIKSACVAVLTLAALCFSGTASASLVPHSEPGAPTKSNANYVQLAAYTGSISEGAPPFPVVRRPANLESAAPATAAESPSETATSSETATPSESATTVESASLGFTLIRRPANLASAPLTNATPDAGAVSSVQADVIQANSANAEPAELGFPLLRRPSGQTAIAAKVGSSVASTEAGTLTTAEAEAIAAALALDTLAVTTNSALAPRVASAPVRRPAAITRIATAVQQAASQPEQAEAPAQPQAQPQAPAQEPVRQVSLDADIDTVENSTSEEDRPASTTRTQTQAGTARTATISNAIPLRDIALVGVIGARSAPKAMIRTPRGGIYTVKVGEQVEGWLVQAIGTREVIIANNSGQERLSLPN